MSGADAAVAALFQFGVFEAFEAVLAIALVLWLATRKGAPGSPALASDPSLVWLSKTPLRSYAAVLIAGIVLRGILLPPLPPPGPIVPDDYSLILQAQTFLAGRLANPPHPLSAFFETMYVNQWPAYASMYFPGRSLPLVVGMLLGHPWFGVWLTMLALAVATVWMLRAWVTAPLAVLGGLLVVFRFGIFSVWINSYYGGTLTALGGVLVIGSFERLRRGIGLRNAVIFATGVLILLVTRPFEGMLFCLPFGAMFLVWLVRRRPSLTWRARSLLAVPSLLAVVAGGVLLGAYNAATTGSPLLTPYEINRRDYAITPAFLISEPPAQRRAIPAYLQHYYSIESMPYREFRQSHDIGPIVWRKVLTVSLFFVGPALLIPFVTGLSAWRRFRVPATGTAAVLAGFAITTWDWAHYIAPAFGFFILVIVVGLERLEPMRWRGRAIGARLSRSLPLLVLGILIVPIALSAAGIALPYSATRACCVTQLNQYPLTASFDRSPAENQLLGIPGRHLVLVKTDPKITLWITWAANGPDIDGSRIIWANDLGPVRNRELLARYPDRRVWKVLVKIGKTPPQLIEMPRPVTASRASAAIR